MPRVRGLAGRDGHAAQVEVAFLCCIAGAEAGENVAAGVGGAGDGVARIAVEGDSADGGDGVANVGQVAVGKHRAQDYVYTLHALAAAEGDGSGDGDRVGGGKFFASEAGEVGGSDGIETIERGDVVGAERGSVGHAGNAAFVAEALNGVHDGPTLQTFGSDLVAGEHLFVGLGPVEAEDLAEGADELVLQNGNLRSVGCAKAVDDHERVYDVARRREIVEEGEDAVLLAGGGGACSWAEEGVDDGAVGVVNDGDGLGRVAGLNIYREGEGAATGGYVGSIHVFAEAAAGGDLHGGSGHGVPNGGSGRDHSIGL